MTNPPTDKKCCFQTVIPKILHSTPAGASTKQVLHFGQLVKNKDLVFQQFDYGFIGNMAKYKSMKPPHYNLSRVAALTYLMYSDNDLLSVESVCRVFNHVQ